MAKTYYAYEVIRYDEKKRNWSHKDSLAFNTEKQANVFAKSESSNYGGRYAVRKVAVKNVYNKGEKVN